MTKGHSELFKALLENFFQGEGSEARPVASTPIVYEGGRRFDTCHKKVFIKASLLIEIVLKLTLSHLLSRFDAPMGREQHSESLQQLGRVNARHL